MKQSYTQIEGKFYQECDIIMLSTNTDSVVKKQISTGILDYSPAMMKMKEKDWENQHLYFISDEEIKKGDKVYHLPSKEIGEVLEVKDKTLFIQYPSEQVICVKYNCKKIIATTDKLLTCNGVKREGESCTYNNNCKFPKCQLPRPSNEFLKRFCELGGIDKVLVEVVAINYPHQQADFIDHYQFKVAPDNTITIKPIQKDNYLFCAYKSNNDYEEKIPYFAKIFTDHTEMKVYSANHGSNEKEKYPDYVSMYWKVETDSK